MVSDVPVSSFLSGGLDSSLISAVANTHTSRLSTYTIASSPEDKKVEQMPEDEIYARKMAEQFDFDHNEICIDSDIVNTLPEMVPLLIKSSNAGGIGTDGIPFLEKPAKISIKQLAKTHPCTHRVRVTSAETATMVASALKRKFKWSKRKTKN